MSQNITNDDIKLNTNIDQPTDDRIKQNNKAINKEKIIFFEFLAYVTKVEVSVDEIQSYLFWVGILEYFLWIILLALFISEPGKMGIIFIFIYHIARGTIGLVIVFHMPKTHQAVENLQNYENSSIEDIKSSLQTNYINLLREKERVLKPLLIVYFSLTMISLIVDVIVFCVVASQFGTMGQEQKVFMMLIAIIAYIIGDSVYISFISSLKFTFPPEQLKAVRVAIVGFFSQLKSGIANGFRGLAGRFAKKTAREAVTNVVAQ